MASKGVCVGGMGCVNGRKSCVGRMRVYKWQVRECVWVEWGMGMARKEVWERWGFGMADVGITAGLVRTSHDRTHFIGECGGDGWAYIGCSVD